MDVLGVVICYLKLVANRCSVYTVAIIQRAPELQVRMMFVWSLKCQKKYFHFKQVCMTTVNLYPCRSHLLVTN